MLKIDVLAVTESGPITTKTTLRTLVKMPQSAVKIIPAHPSPFLVSAISIHDLPVNVPVTVHTSKGTTEVERKTDGKIVIR